MCRSTEIRGFNQQERDRLKIKAFYTRMSISTGCQKLIPESLTLVYLPRINGNPLDVEGSKIRSDSAAFVTLHRVRSAERQSDGGEKEVVFGSRERVRASEGVRFEVYLREEKVLRGIFGKDEEHEWKMECKCALESEFVGFGVTEAEVCVGVEGHVAMVEKVKMVVKRRKKTRAFVGLEEIPEEREVEAESEEEESCCSCSCCGEVAMGSSSSSDGGDCEEEEEEDDGRKDDTEMELEMEGVRWAVDVGIWVMCLGVGFLVSKASSKRLLRQRKFL